MSATASFINWRMAYEITPILLTGGIVSANAQGNALPIVALTNGAASVVSISQPSKAITVPQTNSSVVANAELPNLDGFAIRYYPAPGSLLISNQVAMYPFANQSVAANALIAQPLTVSMYMVCPASNMLSYGQKQVMIMALQSSLAQHNTLGGTYSIVTPAYIYTNCIMTGMRDVTAGSGRQAQETYQLDFVQPLVTQQQAQQAQNTLTQKLTDMTPPSFSGAVGTSGGLPIANPTGYLPTSVPSI